MHLETTRLYNITFHLEMIKIEELKKHKREKAHHRQQREIEEQSMVGRLAEKEADWQPHSRESYAESLWEARSSKLKDVQMQVRDEC